MEAIICDIFFKKGTAANFVNTFIARKSSLRRVYFRLTVKKPSFFLPKAKITR